MREKKEDYLPGRVGGERFWQGGQSWNYEAFYKDTRHTGMVMRVRIERNSYDDQSAAVLTAFNGAEGWTGLQKVPIKGLFCEKVSYVSKSLTDSEKTSFRADADNLVRGFVPVLAAYQK